MAAPGGGMDIRMLSPCPIFTSNTTLPPTQVSVRLTELRMSEQYVVFYHTWAWGLITGYHYYYHYHYYHVIIMFPRLDPRGVPELAEHQHLPGSQDSPLLSQQQQEWQPGQ